MNEYLRLIRMMRYCWICGRYGGGKTTLALKLADKLIRAKVVNKVVLNAPMDIDVPYTITQDERSLSEIRDCVMILDEAGNFIEDGNKKTLKAWFSFLRKRNQIVLMPSVMPVIKYATQFRCQRLFNGQQMGVPMWLYKWRLGLFDTKDSGWFTWWNPAEIFGLVDTDYEPDGRWFIYDFRDVEIQQEQSDIELGGIPDPSDDPQGEYVPYYEIAIGEGGEVIESGAPQVELGSGSGVVSLSDYRRAGRRGS